MKRLALLLLIVLFATGAHAAGEKKQYAISQAPGELYFVAITNVAGGTAAWTNNETYMWYVDKAVVMSQSAVTSTNQLDLVVKHTAQTRTDTQIVTNEFGNVQTNYLHGVGTDVNTYITNTLAIWTNSAATRAAVTPENDYIQRGDLLRWTFSNTNIWLKIIGRR